MRNDGVAKVREDTGIGSSQPAQRGSSAGPANAKNSSNAASTAPIASRSGVSAREQSGEERAREAAEKRHHRKQEARLDVDEQHQRELVRDVEPDEHATRVRPATPARETECGGGEDRRVERIVPERQRAREPIRRRVNGQMARACGTGQLRDERRLRVEQAKVLATDLL